MPPSRISRQPSVGSTRPAFTSCAVESVMASMSVRPDRNATV